MVNHIGKLTFGVFAILVLIQSCRVDENFIEGSVEIMVSEDTIRFDTVFTTLGTVTKYVKIYNRDQNSSLQVQKIELKNFSNFFRLNIDGTPANSAELIDIAPMDSLWVFVEATIDPDLPLEISPYVIEDQLEITINDNSKTVYLEAWGQNANYIPNTDASSAINFFTCDMADWVWDDPKPYVIFGSIIIDSCNVVWPKGTEVYIHGGIAINDLGVYNDGLIFFLSQSSLTSEGTAEEPVIVRTDRLEDNFDDVGGQWSGMIFGANSKTHNLQHTHIQNSIVGVRVDSNAVANFENCSFQYTSGSGIIGRHASITASNCLFHNNLLNGVQLVYGGDYIFNNCTLSSFEGQESAISMNNFQCVDVFCAEGAFVNPLNASFTNCIFSGNDRDEISLGDWTDEDDSDFRYRMNNCYVQVDELIEPNAFPNFFDNCTDCISGSNNDTLYINRRENDLHLDTMSIAIDKGIFIEGVNPDFDDNPRESNAYDLGCYEFQK